MFCMYCSNEPVTRIKVRDRLFSNNQINIAVCRNHINEALDWQWLDYWDKEKDIFEWWRDDTK